ncbi:hypothetical protein ACW73L_07260 [Methylolobus aquaticus]
MDVAAQCVLQINHDLAKHPADLAGGGYAHGLRVRAAPFEFGAFGFEEFQPRLQCGRQSDRGDGVDDAANLTIQLAEAPGSASRRGRVRHLPGCGFDDLDQVADRLGLHEYRPDLGE